MDAAYTEIYQQVLDDVKRPDLWAEILRRIGRSILKYHRLDFWKQDLREQIYYFDTTNTAAPVVYPTVTGGNSLFLTNMAAPNNNINVQVVDTTKLTGFRKIQYIRKFMLVDNYGNPIIDPTTGLWGTVQGGDLTERSPDSMFDGYGYDIQDTFYRQGNDIKINSSTPLGRVFIGWFKDPISKPDGSIDPRTNPTQNTSSTDSWIALNYPNLISADVKAKIFGDIGKTEEVKTANLELGQELMLLQMNSIRTALR